jgi:hypothetical protein
MDCVGNIFLAMTPSAAVEQWATSDGADFYERGMQALVHRWRKCISSGGDCVKKIVFCSQEFALLNSVTMLSVSVVVSMEINRRHYFQSDPHIIGYLEAILKRGTSNTVNPRESGGFL